MFAQRGFTRSPARMPLGAVALFFMLPALLLALLVALLLPAPLAQAATWTVCATGGDYTTIQAAVAAAGAGDVIQICAGSYPENVSLSAMATPGDITLRGTGTVIITPTTGSAIATTGDFPGSVTLENLTAWSADADVVYFPPGFGGSLHVLNLTVTGSGGGGLHATVAGSIDISGTTLVGNGGGGATLYANSPITVENSTFSRNGQIIPSDGLSVAPDFTPCQPDGALVIRNVVAEDNTGVGVGVTVNWSGGVHIADSRMLRNATGLDISNLNTCGGVTAIDNVVADDNASQERGYGYGIYSAARWSQISNVTANGNSTGGIVQAQPAPVAQAAAALAAATTTGNPAPIPVSVSISNTTAARNTGNGIEVKQFDLVTFTNVSAISNTAMGISLAVVSQLVQSADVGAVNYTRAEIANSLVVSNFFGVVIENVTQALVGAAEVSGAPAPPVSVHNSLLCGNAETGLFATGSMSSTYGSPDNYWGDLSGPYNQARNPGGLGNSVIDSTWGQGSGYVAFSPWLGTLATSAVPYPLVVGGDNAVEAHLYGITNGSFLGEGPGNLNDPPPFTLTVENGTLTNGYGTGASVPTRVDAAGLFTATLVPAASGPVTLTVTGPCGDTNLQTFNAAQPQLVATKRPALQTVLPGSTVTFTVDITNTGNLPLTNVIVTDTLAPGCNADIGDLAVDATQQITCTQGPVSADFTNAITVTGQPAPPDCIAGASSALCAQGEAGAGPASVPPDQVVVTATASADVDVVTLGLTATKTAGTDANACAVPGPLTVPTGTSIYYCLRLTNSGDVTLTNHTVNDPLLGINVPLTYTLGPGASLPITRSLIPALGPVAVSAPITNVFAVTSTGVITEVGGVVVPPVPVSVQSTANVVVRTPSTSLPPGVEPLIDNYIFLPSLQK